MKFSEDLVQLLGGDMTNKQRKSNQRRVDATVTPRTFNYCWAQNARQQFYCPTCKATSRPHVEGCKDLKVAVPATARFPKKNASEKVWKRFYDKFVLKLGREEIKKRAKAKNSRDNKAPYLITLDRAKLIAHATGSGILEAVAALQQAKGVKSLAIKILKNK